MGGCSRHEYKQGQDWVGAVRGLGVGVVRRLGYWVWVWSKLGVGVVRGLYWLFSEGWVWAGSQSCMPQGGFSGCIASEGHADIGGDPEAGMWPPMSTLFTGLCLQPAQLGRLVSRDC